MPKESSQMVDKVKTSETPRTQTDLLKMQMLTMTSTNQLTPAI